jgi:hypothetical protein
MHTAEAEKDRPAFERKPVHRKDGRLLIETSCACGFIAVASAYDTLATVEQFHIRYGCKMKTKSA